MMEIFNIQREIENDERAGPQLRWWWCRLWEAWKGIKCFKVLTQALTRNLNTTWIDGRVKFADCKIMLQWKSLHCLSHFFLWVLHTFHF